jgi:deoxyribonuclease V
MLQSLYPLEKLWAITQFKSESDRINRVAGVDVSYRENRYASALVILEGTKISRIKIKSGTSSFPYRPSLFFLKEGPIISDLIYGESVDLLFVNGHGICHPHAYGLATVVGMTHGIPTVGFARELIKGDYDETPSSTSLDTSYVAQKGIIKAAAIKTPKGKGAVYVSQGFGISLKRTIEEYRRWTIRGKVPEPLRLAHLHAKRQLLKGDMENE